MALYTLRPWLLSTLRYLTLSADAREDTLRRLDLTLTKASVALYTLSLTCLVLYAILRSSPPTEDMLATRLNLDEGFAWISILLALAAKYSTLSYALRHARKMSIATRLNLDEGFRGSLYS